MTRYRPPRPKPSPYITAPGHAKLTKELKYLWKEKRPEVTRKVSEAAAMGDRSENAEYIYGKKQLREIDARIAFLSRRLDSLTVVDRAPGDTAAVFFGATVEIEYADGRTVTFRLVGPDEFDAANHYISIDSPMARALLKKRVGDESEVGDRGPFVIRSISYGEVERRV